MKTTVASQGHIGSGDRLIMGSCSTLTQRAELKIVAGYQNFEMNTFNILSPGPMNLSSTLPCLTVVMKIPGSPGTQGLSRPPLIFSPSLPSCPDNETRKLQSISSLTNCLSYVTALIAGQKNQERDLI